MYSSLPSVAGEHVDYCFLFVEIMAEETFCIKASSFRSDHRQNVAYLAFSDKESHVQALLQVHPRQPLQPERFGPSKLHEPCCLGEA